MGRQYRKMTGWAARILPAVLWLMVAATCIVPAYAQQPDASLPKGSPPATSVDDASSPPSDAAADPEAMLPHFKDTRFWLSGQANFIFQTHSGFHADYSGKNSLSTHYD